jgi:hypothetical protein
MADIFLSHSSVDDEAADRIKSWLARDRESWSVFLDKHSHDGILAGQGWQDRLRRELQSCRVVLAIVTKDWLASRWCFTEAVTANFRGKDFFGVLLGPLPDGVLDVAPPIVHERQRQPVDLITGGGWRSFSTRSIDPGSIRTSGSRSPRVSAPTRASWPSRKGTPESSLAATRRSRSISTS